MERKLRRCCVCKDEYQFCPKCPEDANKEIWHFTFCSKNCHDIYDVTSKFENNQISGENANSVLDRLNLSKMDSFGSSYKNTIAKIREACIVVKDVHSVEEENTETSYESNAIFADVGTENDDVGSVPIPVTKKTRTKIKKTSASLDESQSVSHCETLNEE